MKKDNNVVIKFSTTLSLLVLLWLLQPFFSPCATAATAASCSICPNPQQSITIPNATFPIFGSCDALNNIINLIPQDSDNCRLIQSVSTLCGCPVSESSCFICSDNQYYYSNNNNNNTNNNNNDSISSFDSNRPVPYFIEVPGINFTCDIFQAYMHSIPANDSKCSLSQALIGSYCGCPSSSASNNNYQPCSLCKSGRAATLPNRTLSLGYDVPFLNTCGDLERVVTTYWQDGSDTCNVAQRLGTYCGCLDDDGSMDETPPCTFCKDGSAVTIPNKTIPFLKDQLNLAGLEPTCGLMDVALQSLPESDPICGSARLLGSYCGCPPVPNHCTYCRFPDDRITTPKRVIREFALVSGLPDLTCEDIWWTQYQVSENTPPCWMVQGKSYLCGCNHGQFEYLGTNTITKKRQMVWIPRFTAFMSFLGSLYIIIDVYRKHWKPLDQYHELVASMACFDIMGSLAAMFTTLPIPMLDPYGLPTGIYGARGNRATCKTQGFFIQLGYTGVFYNLALAMFYVLVVNYNYRDRDLKRVRKYFHIPALVGVALAFAGIPYYDNFIWACQIPSRPIIQSYRYMFIFIFYPISIAVGGSGVAVCMVYLKVRRLSQASRKWRFSQRFGRGGGAGGKLARKVFWQAFFFVVALYETWPLLLVAEFSSTTVIHIYEHHWVWVLTLSIAPLQGFFNAFVYARPKLMRIWRQLRRRRERQRPAVVRNPSWARRAMRMSRPAQNGFRCSDSSSSSSDHNATNETPSNDNAMNLMRSRRVSIRAPAGEDMDELDETESTRVTTMSVAVPNHDSCTGLSSCAADVEPLWLGGIDTDDSDDSFPIKSSIVAPTIELSHVSMVDVEDAVVDPKKLDSEESSELDGTESSKEENTFVPVQNNRDSSTGLPSSSAHSAEAFAPRDADLNDSDTSSSKNVSTPQPSVDLDPNP